MSNWSFPSPDNADDDLRSADLVLGKADALLRRHKGTEPQRYELSLPEPEEFVSLDDDDLPVLTDIVDQAEWQTAPSTPCEEAAPPAHPRSMHVNELAEQLISLDTEISRAVETWFASELPQLLSRELDKLASRVQQEAVAHLRATLLPTLSEHISRSLEKNTDLRP